MSVQKRKATIESTYNATEKGWGGAGGMSALSDIRKAIAGLMSYSSAVNLNHVQRLTSNPTKTNWCEEIPSNMYIRGY